MPNSATLAHIYSCLTSIDLIQSTCEVRYLEWIWIPKWGVSRGIVVYWDDPVVGNHESLQPNPNLVADLIVELGKIVKI